MTQTERLRAVIFKSLENNAYETDQIEAILKACKEASLKFVYDIQAPAFGKQWARFEEIEVE